MRSSILRRAGAAIAVAALGAPLLCGCGSGSGSSSNAAQISGQVRSAGMITTAAVQIIPVRAYMWPDLSTPVVETTADSTGRYTMTMPGTTVGRDVIVIATHTPSNDRSSRASGATYRASRIVADLPAFGKTEADLDQASTAAAEASIAYAKSISADDIHGSAYATLVTDLHSWSGISRMDLMADGADLPLVFGGGLKDPEGSCGQYLKTDDTCKRAILLVAEAGNSDVKRARRIAQMLRDFGDGVINPMSSEAGNLLWTTIEQQSIFETEGQISTIFTNRVRLVLGLMDITNQLTLETLKRKVPGQYEVRLNSPGLMPTHILVRVGDAPDGKSWIVTSKVNDSDLNTQVTITPKNAIDTFDFTSRAGGYTLKVRKSDDASVIVDGTLNATAESGGTVTSAVGDISVADKVLKSPITAHGTFTGVPAAGSSPDNEKYTSVSFSGSLNSQVAVASVENLTATWYTSSNANDFKSVQITNLRAATPFTKPITLIVNSAGIEFEAADPTHGYPDPTPKHATFDGSVEVSGNKLEIKGGDMTFVRTLQAGNIGTFRVTGLPDTIRGTATYNSSVLHYVGTLDVKWNNPAENVNGANAASRFPLGTAHYTGDLRPVVGSPSFIDMTLQSSIPAGADINNGATITVKLSLNRLAFPKVNGGEVLTGTIAAAMATAAGKVLPNPVVTADIKHQPTGFAVNIHTLANSGIVGTIMNGTTKLAEIGRASDLGMPELGTGVIIKYVDGTFETAVSILPYMNLSVLLG